MRIADCSKRLVLAILVTLLSAPAAAQETSEVERLRTAVEQLEKTVQELKARLSALEKEKAAAPVQQPQQQPAPAPTSPAPTPTPAPTAGLVPDYNTMGDQQPAAPRPDNVPLDPELKGFLPIPGTLSMVRFGGSARVDAIYDLANNGNPNWFVPSSIPVPGQSGTDGGGRFTLQAKATRMSLEFRRPFGSSDRLRIYYENDFFGDSSSPTMTYRLRHFYGQAWNFLLGQTFSAFANVDSWPDTVDYEGPNAMIMKRQPQVRYTQPLSRTPEDRQVVFLSVEQSGSEVDVSGFPPDGAGANRLPDFVLGYRRERKIGHVQLSTILRSIGIDSVARGDEKILGWGFNLSGAVNVLAADNVSYQIAYGEGIARYVNDLSGLNMDAGADESGNLKAIPVFAPAIGYNHRWSAFFRSTASWGYVWTDPVASLGPLTVRRTQYAGLNLVWQPTKAFRSGLEYLWGRKETVNGASRDASRIGFVVKYDLVK
ncbi:MAG: DcaP family trimeric outer membrane transporter [Thermoanaerobaculia bacterium]